MIWRIRQSCLLGCSPVFFFLLASLSKEKNCLVECCVEENGLLGLQFWVVALSKSACMLKAVLHGLQAENCTILMAWSSVISATYQLWCLMQLACSSSVAKVVAQRVYFAITCTLHRCWSHSGARCFGRLRSLAPEKLKYGAALPDPKGLGNQIRQSLALRLSGSLDIWCFQVHRTIEYAVLKRLFRIMDWQVSEGREALWLQPRLHKPFFCCIPLAGKAGLARGISRELPELSQSFLQGGMETQVKVVIY